MRLLDIEWMCENPCIDKGSWQELPLKKDSSTANSYLIIESRLLDGECLVFCKEKSALAEVRKKYPDYAVYFQPEIEALAQIKNRAEIKKLHLIKKLFRGWIITQKGKQSCSPLPKSVSDSSKPPGMDYLPGLRV